MKTLPFKSSSSVSIGVELEFQIVDPLTFNLISRAKDLIRNIADSPFQKIIKPEITQSMIEINSSVHRSPLELYAEFQKIQEFLLLQARDLGVSFSGGGTHPFQKWTLLKIFPTKRFKNKSRLYRYLSKRSTVFGQHIHIGCKSGEDAIYLAHALARYVPQLIAINASSPFYQGIDTGFCSSRVNIFSSFPMSGVMPYFTSWNEFSDYFYKMRKLGIIETMKDVYWDIRPKPEFGTVEIRVCDTPLSIKTSVIIAAFVQSLACYLLKEKPAILTPDLYFLYNYNRFQASRYGFDGEFVNPNTLQHSLIGDDILETVKIIEKYANDLNNMGFISQLVENVINKQNDAIILREVFKKTHDLSNVVREQCLIWENNN